MKVVVGLLVSLYASVATAQVNVEPITSAATEPGWGLKIAAGFGFASGNTAYTDLSGDGSARYVTLHPNADPDDPHNIFRDRVVLNGSIKRRGYPDGKVLDGRFVHARYTRMQWQKFGGEVFAQVGNDRLLLQNWRVLGGAGIRAVIADTQVTHIIFGTGYMYEFEDRNIGEDAPDPVIEVDHRSTTYASIKLTLVPDRVNIQHTVYLQPRFDAPKDIQVLNDSALSVQIVGSLSLTTSLFLRYDSRPPSELVPLDVRMSNGLSLSF